MRIQYLSDHARDQLGVARQQLDVATAAQAAWQHAHHRALDDAQAARKAKSGWRRLLNVSTGEERAARARVAQAEQSIHRATAGVHHTQRTAQQHAAGVAGEDALSRALARLSDDWVMLRGYRNRRGETDQLLVGPSGVWAIEVKRRAVRVHIVGDRWTFEKLDRRGNVVETGSATDHSGRSWARQVTDVAADLGAWLAKNGHTHPIRTAVMLMHERARIGRHEQLTVDLVANHPDHLLTAIHTSKALLSAPERGEIIRLIERDHLFHEQRRSR